MGVLNIYDILFAHNVPAYVATRKLRAQSNSPAGNPEGGAASAVHDCLVRIVAYIETATQLRSSARQTWTLDTAL